LNSHGKGGPGARGEEGTAISLSPRKPRSLPRCISARAVARHPRPTRKRSGIPAVIHCAIPRTHRWAGAATPTQRNTAQALDRAKRASDVINIINCTSKDNPHLLPVQVPQPRPPAVALVRDRSDSHPAGTRVRDRLGLAVGMALDWLAYFFLRRRGDRWFAVNDTEAHWWGWQIAKRCGGLGRRYRDIRFGTLAACERCAGAGVWADALCGPCLGMGRITLGEVS